MRSSKNSKKNLKNQPSFLYYRKVYLKVSKILFWLIKIIKYNRRIWLPKAKKTTKPFARRLKQHDILSFPQCYYKPRIYQNFHILHSRLRKNWVIGKSKSKVNILNLRILKNKFHPAHAPYGGMFLEVKNPKNRTPKVILHPNTIFKSHHFVVIILIHLYIHSSRQTIGPRDTFYVTYY